MPRRSSHGSPAGIRASAAWRPPGHVRSGLFADGSRAGTQAELTATADRICVVVAPGGPMVVDQQNPPTDRYYDEMGYLGHRNCSDNFNAELSPYGIANRRGWMAMNFFYNTNIDDHNVLSLDESWSRPGGYVLLRALTDLVCVSSACPDDSIPRTGGIRPMSTFAFTTVSWRCAAPSVSARGPIRR